MIYTTTLNPSIDYIMRVKDYRNGVTNRSFYEVKIPGGKGIMVSKLLKSLGIKSCNIGFIGGYTGNYIKNALDEIKIYTKFTKIKDDTRINVKLKSEMETEINARGPVISDKEIEQFFSKLKEVEKKDIVVLSGSIPSSLEEDFYERIVLEIRKKEVEFVIDTTGEKLLKTLIEKPLLIKPNKEELEELFNVKIGSIQEIVPYGRELLKLGAENVIVSLGGNGAMYFNEDLVLYAPVIEGKLVNSVGAGDSMIGGFLYGLENNLSKENCFKWAVASGTATAFSEDIGNREFIEEMFKRVKIKTL